MLEAVYSALGTGKFIIPIDNGDVDAGGTKLHLGPIVAGEVECLAGTKVVTFSAPVPKATIAMGVTVSIASIEITPTQMTATVSKFGIGFRRRINMSLEGM